MEKDQDIDDTSSESSDDSCIEFDLSLLCLMLDLDPDFPIHVEKPQYETAEEEENEYEQDIEHYIVSALYGQDRIGPMLMRCSIPMFDVSYTCLRDKDELTKIHIEPLSYWSRYEEAERDEKCGIVKQWLEDSLSHYRTLCRTRLFQTELFSHSALKEE